MQRIELLPRFRKLVLLGTALSLSCICILAILSLKSQSEAPTALIVESWAGDALEAQLKAMREKLQSSARVLQSHHDPDTNVWERSAAEEWDRVMGSANTPMLAGSTAMTNDKLSRSSFVVGDSLPSVHTELAASPISQSEIMNSPPPLGAPQLSELLPSPFVQPAELSYVPPTPSPVPPAVLLPSPEPREKGRSSGLTHYQEAMLRAILRSPPRHTNLGSLGLTSSRVPVVKARHAQLAQKHAVPALGQALAARADGVLARADDVLARAAAAEEDARAAAARRLRAEQGVLSQAAKLSSGAKDVLDAVRLPYPSRSQRHLFLHFRRSQLPCVYSRDCRTASCIA